MCGPLRGWAFGCIYLVELCGMGDKKGVHYNIDTCGLFGGTYANKCLCYVIEFVISNIPVTAINLLCLSYIKLVCLYKTKLVKRHCKDAAILWGNVQHNWRFRKVQNNTELEGTAEETIEKLYNILQLKEVIGCEFGMVGGSFRQFKTSVCVTRKSREYYSMQTLLTEAWQYMNESNHYHL